MLVEGIVKLEKPGFSQRTLAETIVVSEGMMFGEGDLRMEERVSSAVVCSARVEVLAIPKR